MNNKEFCTLAMSFEAVEELPHFELTSFRINNKIIATLDAKSKRAMISLSPKDQSVFTLIDKEIIYPVPNKWGLKGATYFQLAEARKEIILDALRCAYLKLAPKELVKKLNDRFD